MTLLSHQGIFIKRMPNSHISIITVDRRPENHTFAWNGYATTKYRSTETKTVIKTDPVRPAKQ